MYTFCWIIRENCGEKMEQFLERCFYHSGQYDSQGNFAELDKKLKEHEVLCVLAACDRNLHSNSDVRHFKMTIPHGMLTWLNNLHGYDVVVDYFTWVDDMSEWFTWRRTFFYNTSNCFYTYASYSLL